MLEEGTVAPEFTLEDQNGEEHNLRDYRGQWVLIYFYPKDDTPGCTKEACMIRDVFPDFGKLTIQVFGISRDSVRSHKKFAEKYNLPFPLLADIEEKVVSAYGVLGEKTMFGKKYKGVLRTSFLVNPDGIIQKVYRKVKPEVHATQVLTDVTTYGKAS